MLSDRLREHPVYRRLQRSPVGRIVRWLRKYLRENVAYGNFSLNMNSRGYWDAKLASIGEHWRDENYRHVIDFLPDDRPATLLDIGCAVGDGCEYIRLSRPNIRVVGADFSRVGIEQAREKAARQGLDLEYVELDILEDQIPEIFDLITIVETLEHFNDPFTVVDKCIRSCSDKLVISVPYSEDGSGPSRSLGEHRYCFDEGTFRDYEELAEPFVTPYVEATKSRCIIYNLRGRSR